MLPCPSERGRPVAASQSFRGRPRRRGASWAGGEASEGGDGFELKLQGMRNLTQFSQVGFVSSHCNCSARLRARCVLPKCPGSYPGLAEGVHGSKEKLNPTLMRLSLQFLQPCRDLNRLKSARQAPNREFQMEEGQERTPRAILCLTKGTDIYGMDGTMTARGARECGREEH